MRERDIRLALRAELETRFGWDSATLILDELGVLQGASRVDLAVINGSLHGYEIKSAQDTLARLPAQAAAFSRVLDFVTIVTSGVHLSAVSSRVPAWWGISVPVSSGGSIRFDVERTCYQNPGLDPRSIAELLWKEEAISLLASHGIAGGVTRKPRQYLWDLLSERVALEDLAAGVRAAMKTRAGWRVAP